MVLGDTFGEGRYDFSMGYQLKRWPLDIPPSSTDIELIYEKEALQPYSWSNGPGDTYAAHTHSYRKVLHCVRGSIVFKVDGETVELNPGDRLDLSPGTQHAAEVGPEGVTCLEAHL